MNTIIFSDDSPMRLYALLESIKLFCPTIKKPKILYKYSSIDYYIGYIKTFADFPDIETIQIKNFKEDLIHTENLEEEYTLFLSDHSIFIRPFEKFVIDREMVCFSLTLGKNIKDTPQDLRYLYKKSLEFTGEIYNSSIIYSILRSLKYDSELSFDQTFKSCKLKQAYIGMHKQSSLINLFTNPPNKEGLNKLFLEGKKIDIASYFDLNNDLQNIITEYPFKWR